MLNLASIKHEWQRRVAKVVRLSSCHGFGIQSPWAYRMMTTVIATRLTDSEKEALRELNANLSKRRQTYYELLYRLARNLHPDCFVDTTGDNQSADYISAAHHSVVTCTLSELFSNKKEQTLMIRTDILCSQLASIVEMMQGESMLIIDGIRSNKSSKEAWHRLQQSDKTGVTFDLFDHALVFFSTARPKQHYLGSCV